MAFSPPKCPDSQSLVDALSTQLAGWTNEDNFDRPITAYNLLKDRRVSESRQQAVIEAWAARHSFGGTPDVTEFFGDICSQENFLDPSNQSNRLAPRDGDPVPQPRLQLVTVVPISPTLRDLVTQFAEKNSSKYDEWLSHPAHYPIPRVRGTVSPPPSDPLDPFNLSSTQRKCFSAVVDFMNQSSRHCRWATWLDALKLHLLEIDSHDPEDWVEALGMRAQKDQLYLLFAYPARDIELYRPTQLDAGWFALHCPAPALTCSTTGLSRNPGHTMHMHDPGHTLQLPLLDEVIHDTRSCPLKPEHLIAAGRASRDTDLAGAKFRVLRQMHWDRMACSADYDDTIMNALMPASAGWECYSGYSTRSP